MFDSLEKINSSIQYALSYIIREEYPDHIISLTNVKSTPDLEYCDILVSVLDDNPGLVSMLNHDSRKLRKILAESDINLRRTPILRFEIDNSDSNYNKIDKLLKE